MVQKALKLGERVEVKPQLQSELGIIGTKYGVDLGTKEAKAVVESAMKGLRSTAPAEVHERVQSALLSYLSKTDPGRAKTLYNQIEGKKYWEGLGLEKVKVTIEGKETTVRRALNGCNELEGEKKAERFREIVSQLAENFRTRSDMQNSLGIRYSVESTDPGEVLTQRAFNCFSGSIVLGQLITYAAGEVDLQNEVSAKVQQVASYTLGGKWDDAGHAIVKVVFYGLSDEKRRTVFFDPMNTVIARHERSLTFDPNSGILSSSLLGNMHYRLGRTLDIAPNLVETARFQDGLFGMQSLDPRTVSHISKMPPLFLSYFVNHMTTEQQRGFFSGFNVRAIGRITSPALRYRLAAIAAAAFAEANPGLASQFGTMALSSLRQAIATERTMLPLGASLDNTISLVSVMGQTPKGRRMIADSGIWAYLPYVASTSIAEVSSESASRARDFLVGFYTENSAFISSFAEKNPLALVNYCQGVLTLSSIGGSTTQSEQALNSLYAIIGVNRQELVGTMRTNARSVRMLGMNKRQPERFLSGAKADYFLERNFLIVASEILGGTFSAERTRQRVLGLAGPSAIVGRSILMTIRKESLGNVLLAKGPMMAAARKKGLV